MELHRHATLQSPAFSTVLRHAASVFALIVGIRNYFYDRFPILAYRACRPVMSIGAVHAGGTGKTPLALLTARMLSAQGYTVAFLSRGYRRRLRAIAIVEPHQPASWEQVGDEPALLHANLPDSWLGIGPNRRTTAKILQSRLPRRAVFVLDDGFQHRRLARDIDIVCLPSDPFNDKLLPAGNLREPLTSLKRAHLLCIIGSPHEPIAMEATRKRLSKEFPSLPVALLHQTPVGWITLAGEKIDPQEMPPATVAVCGIARPYRFVDTIKTYGIKPKRTFVFPDHYIYNKADVSKMLQDGETMILTTEKDAFRLSSLGLVSGNGMCYLKMEVSFADPASRHTFEKVLGERGI